MLKYILLGFSILIVGCSSSDDFDIYVGTVGKLKAEFRLPRNTRRGWDSDQNIGSYFYTNAPNTVYKLEEALAGGSCCEYYFEEYTGSEKTAIILLAPISWESDANESGFEYDNNTLIGTLTNNDGSEYKINLQIFNQSQNAKQGK